MALLYLETNYLMSVATGRYPAVELLLPHVPQNIRLVMPAACIMESLTALENEQSHRRGFTSQIDYQIKQLTQGTESARAQRLLAHLEHSRLENEALVNDLHARLIDAIHAVTNVGLLLEAPPAVIRQSTEQQLCSQPTDNLIVLTIAQHARGHASEQKALFSANIDDFKRGNAGTVLVNSGVRRFLRNYDSLMRWLQHVE